MLVLAFECVLGLGLVAHGDESTEESRTCEMLMEEPLDPQVAIVSGAFSGCNSLLQMSPATGGVAATWLSCAAQAREAAARRGGRSHTRHQ